MNKLKIVSGNILEYLDDVDAIVNSANKYMKLGSGISGFIYKTANKEKLENYCDTNFKTEMQVNEVRITPGFDLKLDILHIYAPKFYNNENAVKELLEGYEKIFITAKEHGYNKLVSVSLGTGVHGYKHEIIGKEVYTKLIELTGKYDIFFTLVIYDKEDLKFYDS